MVGTLDLWQVVAALRAVPGAATDIRAPQPAAGGARGLVSADGRSELVTFAVA